MAGSDSGASCRGASPSRFRSCALAAYKWKRLAISFARLADVPIPSLVGLPDAMACPADMGVAHAAALS